jgi:hypothetical protein
MENHLGELDIDKGIILKLILKEYDGRTWSSSVRLAIWASGGHS